MKLPYLPMLLLLVTCGCGQSPQPTWKPLLDGGHHVGMNGVTIFAFAYNDAPDRSVVFYFSFGINSSSNHSSNAKSRTFDYSGAITTSPSNEAVLDYHIASTDATKIRCNETDYQLQDGAVFHVGQDGTVTQLPFSGLKPTEEYVSDLQDYFAERQPKPSEATK